MLLLQDLIREEAKILYPATTLVEATTTLQRKLHKTELAAQIAGLVKENQFPIESMSEDILYAAVSYFKPEKSSKHNILLDAVVAAVAKKTNADAILSFDKWYTKQGFTLVADL